MCELGTENVWFHIDILYDVETRLQLCNYISVLEKWF